jgi:anti-sigma regulatory factor (Ser/Thr protein kinase)
MTGGSSLRTAAPRDHAVQFYQDDHELAASVGSYLAEGLRSGDGVIVVATTPHRLMFETVLAQAGIDVAGERNAGRLLTEDAAGLLRRILGKDGLDHGHFRSVISGLIHLAAASGRRVRIYGEMVGLLWDAGHVAMAIELETLWNGLGARVPFSLLCGYPCHPVASGATADAAREVGGLHSNVIVTRSFPAELDSVRAARHVTADLLDGETAQRLAEDAAIVVTELTSNAVLHAQSGFTLTISRSATSVRIAVRDSQPLVSEADTRPFDIKAGHGLSVVVQLARAWDVERRPDGKVVWAELSAS